MTTAPAPALLEKFGVSDPVFAAQSGIATVWKVKHGAGAAALKIYNGFDPKDEWPGFDLIHGLDGAGVVRIFQYDSGVALMEWLGGPSLGDISRGGDDQQAAMILAKVAQKIHSACQNYKFDLQPVAHLFCDLFAYDTSDPALARCVAIARDLIASQSELIPLHGDLHHDNIMRGDRGYVAFDAKGVLGEPAFDFAQAFCNPIGPGDMIYDPELARDRALIWGHAAGIPPHRLLEWAVARRALSLSWGSDAAVVDEHRMIHMLLDLLDDL